MNYNTFESKHVEIERYPCSMYDVSFIFVFIMSTFVINISGLTIGIYVNTTACLLNHVVISMYLWLVIMTSVTIGFYILVLATILSNIMGLIEFDLLVFASWFPIKIIVSCFMSFQILMTAFGIGEVNNLYKDCARTDPHVIGFVIFYLVFMACSFVSCGFYFYKKYYG